MTILRERIRIERERERGHSKGFYSCNRQDYIIYTNFFQKKEDGIFFDVGGNLPINCNNTMYFEEIGWSGYAIEPLPSMKTLWDKHRKATFFPFGASEKQSELLLSVVESNNGTSFIKETKEKAPAYRRNSKTMDIIIKVIPLKNIFKKEGITHIDYMSIDIEGHELKALKGIDFNKIRINVLTIENLTSSAYGDDEVRDVMLKNNYIFWGRIGIIDDIYVHKEFLNS